MSTFALQVGKAYHVDYSQVIITGFHLNYFSIEPFRTSPNAKRSPLYPDVFEWPIWPKPFNFQWRPSTSPLDPAKKYFHDFSLITDAYGHKYNYLERTSRGNVKYIAKKGQNFAFNGELEMSLQMNPVLQFSRRIPSENEEQAQRRWGFLRVDSIWNGVDFKLKCVAIVTKNPRQEVESSTIQKLTLSEINSLSREGLSVHVVGYTETHLVEIACNHLLKI